jgi:hypothetical protein
MELNKYSKTITQDVTQPAAQAKGCPILQIRRKLRPRVATSVQLRARS